MNPTNEPTTPSPSQASPQVSGAVVDLAEALDVPSEEVEVISVEEVTWRDGSLGCAREGMAYTQAIVDGTRIILEADGAEHEYHAAAGKPAFRCVEPTQ